MREPRDDGPFPRLKKKPKKTPWPEQPPRRAGGVAAQELRARLHPAIDPRGTPVGKVLSPSLRTHVVAFGRATATKCVSPETMAPFQKGRFHFHTPQ
jgi:hypothetical protein